MLKKLSSEYQLYTCGNFFRIPRFEKKLLFSDSLQVLLKEEECRNELESILEKSDITRRIECLTDNDKEEMARC